MIWMPLHSNHTPIVLQLLANPIGVIVVHDDCTAHACRCHPVELRIKAHSRKKLHSVPSTLRLSNSPQDSRWCARIPPRPMSHSIYPSRLDAFWHSLASPFRLVRLSHTTHSTWAVLITPTLGWTSTDTTPPSCQRCLCYDPQQVLLSILKRIC